MCLEAVKTMGARVLVALIVVSNRVVVGVSGEPVAGGLAIALADALKRYGGIWIGWSGETNSKAVHEIRLFASDGISYGLIDLTEQDYEEYYSGFANRTLWPLMHYRLGLTEFSPGDFAGYKRVNAAFAQRLLDISKPGDLIWVHDYHLIPLAHEMTLAGVTNRMGYFHHIPWPPPEVFCILPAARELLRAMMDYDVVGFQTEKDRDHFCQCLTRELDAQEIAEGHYHVGTRHVRVIALPIGINAESFAAAARNAGEDQTVIETIASIGERSLIIGVDRLDYSKGVAQRMEAYGQFLSDNPHRQAAVEYLQITPLSRSDIPEYEQINQQVAETAGRINGASGEPSWTPIRYLNKAYSRDVLAGLYRAARVGLVTPIRDGMNLVAKEFVAAQDPDDPGVLVLSRFAGAAQQLTSAVIINPFDRSGMANGIETALSMPLSERQQRWDKMMSNTTQQDVVWWIDQFYALLSEPFADNDRDQTGAHITRADI
jgi:trehalose 6-phosphate synthase